MRIACLSILIVFVCVSPAFGQRDAPVWESYLPRISIYSDDNSGRPSITVDFVFKKNGGPHEHTEHQAYILVYLKKDEEQILKLTADPELTKKKNEKTKSFLDVLVEKKLVVTLDSQVAPINRSLGARYEDVRGTAKRTGAESITEFGFPFKFTFANDALFKAVQQLGNFNIKSVDVAGSSTWFEDRFKLMVLVPVNDSALANKVTAKLHEMYDFASLMNFETSLLYFRPLPYEFAFKKYGEDRLLIYIN